MVVIHHPNYPRLNVIIACTYFPHNCIESEAIRQSQNFSLIITPLLLGAYASAVPDSARPDSILVWQIELNIIVTETSSSR
jgi:hypothetical protein